MEHRSGNIGERQQKIRQQGFMIVVILGNGSEEKVFIELITDFAPTNFVIDHLFRIRFSVKIAVNVAQFHFDPFVRLIIQARVYYIAVTLVRIQRVKNRLNSAVRIPADTSFPNQVLIIA